MAKTPIRSIKNVTGTQTLDVPNGYNYYSITIESESSQTYTIKRLVETGERYVDFSDNVVEGDTSTTFFIPFTEGIQLIPSDTDSYSVITSAIDEK